MRLDKLLAHTGYGTRAEVKRLLKTKTVTLNGQVAQDGKIQVDLKKDQVLVAGQLADYREFVYLMMNKPQDCLSATTDRSGRTVIDLLSEEYRRFDMVPAGRLDRNTEGLMLLTNDGALVHSIISPKKEVYKQYLACLDGELTPEKISLLEAGVEIRDGADEIYRTKPARITLLEPQQGRQAALIEITEGKFHQVKRMFASVGCKVTYLKRNAIGRLKLDDSLALGQYRELTEVEISILRGH